jgi:arginine utilization protein RocB
MTHLEIAQLIANKIDSKSQEQIEAMMDIVCDTHGIEMSWLFPVVSNLCARTHNVSVPVQNYGAYSEAETMAKLTEERDAALQARNEAAGQNAQYLSFKAYLARIRAEHEIAADRTTRAHEKRDKLAQRFAAAMLADCALRVEPDRLHELAYGYADAFYPESDR